MRNGRLHRVHRGVYGVGYPPVTLPARFAAAVLACGERAYLSHFSAAALFDLLRWEERRVEVTVARGAAVHKRGLVVHRARALDAADVDRRDAIPVTSVARTLLDVAWRLAPRTRRRVVRQALGERIVTIEQLRDVVSRSNGHPGTTALAQLVGPPPAATRSLLEDLLLDLVIDAGLPRPDVNVALAIGARTVVPDLRWPQARLVVEADGAAWHDNRVAREDDTERQALLEAAGERVLRVTWDQVARRPRQTTARIRAALDARATAPTSR